MTAADTARLECKECGSQTAYVTVPGFYYCPPCGKERRLPDEAKVGPLNPISQIQNGLEGHNGTVKEVGPLNPARLLTTRVSAVQREDVGWRWSDRLAIGKLHVIDGDPGTGKSFLAAALCTSYSLGLALPGDSEQFAPQDVLIFTAEDGIADTIRPRLEDMGADLDRVTVVTGAVDADGAEHFPNLNENLLLLESELSKGSYGLLILDPLNAYLKGVSGDRDIELRSILGLISQLAESYGVTIICICIRHLTKGNRERAIYRGQGSIAYVAAARVVWVVGVNPDDKAERVVVPIKNNLAPLAEPVAFEIAEGRFRWKGLTDVTAEALLAPDAQLEERSAREEAAEFLLEALADGPRFVADVLKQARSHGISERTLKRAKSEVGVVAEPYYEEGKRGAAGWKWRLPDGFEGQVSARAPYGTLNDFESSNGHLEGQTSEVAP